MDVRRRWDKSGRQETPPNPPEKLGSKNSNIHKDANENKDQNMKHNSNAGAFAGLFPFPCPPPLPQVSIVSFFIIMGHAKLLG